jgi:hypothetical protein
MSVHLFMCPSVLRVKAAGRIFINFGMELLVPEPTANSYIQIS